MRISDWSSDVCSSDLGIRNALVTSIAPTGTISLFADNVSSGIEPVFSYSYMRDVLLPYGARRQEQVSHYAYRLYRRLHGEDGALPDYFVDAQRSEEHTSELQSLMRISYAVSCFTKEITITLLNLSFTSC